VDLKSGKIATVVEPLGGVHGVYNGYLVYIVGEKLNKCYLMRLNLKTKKTEKIFPYPADRFFSAKYLNDKERLDLYSKLKQLPVIDSSKCLKCDECVKSCPNNAIVKNTSPACAKCIKYCIKFQYQIIIIIL
jgi:NAD-dependent dihydropyrimidine dehydrogenase PreA subunit